MTTGKRIVFSVLAGFVPMLMWAHKSGADPGHTKAPGEDPLACSTATCHTNSLTGGPLNAFGGSVTATFSNGSFYSPGQTINIEVSVSDPVNAVWHGFQMSSRLDSNNGQAGSFRTSTGSVVLCADGSTEGVPRFKNVCPNSEIEYITHSDPATGTWKYSWVAPATDVGPIHFYLAGNAVNHDDQADGNDHPYTKQYVLNPISASCTVGVPSITQVRRIEGWGDGGAFSSGSWLEIKGSNLAQATGPWLDADFVGGVARTTLGGTSVSVNGKTGLVEYISPGQINLQAPSDTATGLVPVTVTNCAGSKTFTDPNLQKNPVAPGLLAPDSQYFVVGGKQFLAATIGFQNLFVGNTSLLPGLFQPAKPGDTILLYAIGLGDTTPPNTPGVIATGQEKLNSPVTVKFGTAPAVVQALAMYPTFVGLYYIMVTVPNPLANGDYQINVTVGGQPLQQSPPFFLTVHN